MCLQHYSLKPFHNYNWDGDVIIHDCIVPSGRPIVNKRSNDYFIDVREFLTSDKNALIHKTIYLDVKKIIEGLNGNWDYFISHDPGSFDYKAAILQYYVSRKIDYLHNDDYWLFPDETLALKKGDCEDRAFLLASLMLASGISSYNIRVALGKLRHTFLSKRKIKDYTHMWVMYKNEFGEWNIVDPPFQKHPSVKKEKQKQSHLLNIKQEYIPSFVFNDSHLWSIGKPRRAIKQTSFNKRLKKLKKDWKKFNPAFEGNVHYNIIDKVMEEFGAEFEAVRHLLHEGIGIPTVWLEDRDNPFKYDPLDHFDNGFIEKSWERVKENLDKIIPGNLWTDNIHFFSMAAHGIADFYAHSSYAHFGCEGNLLKPYIDENGNINDISDRIIYNQSNNFDFGNYPKGNPSCTVKGDQRTKAWQHKIITGRYAQEGDNMPLIGVQRIAKANWPRNLKISNGQKALPHHNQIAVDSTNENGSNLLYESEKKGGKYHFQYNLRFNAAVKHIGQEFKKRKNLMKPPDKN